MKEAFNVFVDNDGIIILFYFEINILAGYVLSFFVTVKEKDKPD